MTLDDLQRTWTARRNEWRRFADLHSAAIADAFLADLAELERETGDELLTLRAAARESGYSEDHLGRLMRQGEISNHGRPRAPRVRRRDLPRKLAVTQLHAAEVDAQLSPRRKLALSVANSSRSE